MSRKRIIMATAALAIVLSAIAPASANAASSTAAITGRVLDNGGSVLKGLTVQAKSTTGEVYTTTSDAKGRFYLKNLRPGSYGLKFSDHVGLYPCPEGSCSKKFSPYLNTEWLGDAKTFSTSKKITLSAGEKHTGVRELVDHYARLSGKVFVNGQKGTYKSGVIVDTIRVKNGKSIGGQLASGRYFDDVDTPGDYRYRVRSYTHAFTPFYIVDPRDGNTVFHFDGIEKLTGVTVNVSIPQ